MVTQSNRRRRRLQRLGLAVATIYAMILSAVVGGCADRLILYPTNQPIQADGIERHTITCQDKTVEIWYCKSAGVTQHQPPQAYVLSFVGNASRAEWTAPFFAKDWGSRPVEVWAVNYPGYGGSEGPARLRSMAPVALAAYDALYAVAADKPIFIDARSIGTAAGLYGAALRKVAGCVLHNPPPLRRLILGRFGWWNLWLLAGPVSLSIPSELDSIANAKSVSAPAVFMLAGADEVVPPGYQKLVVDAYAGPKRLVHLPGAGHNDRAEGDALIQEQAGLDWLWQSAGLSSAEPGSSDAAPHGGD